jgi:hypothetical protein
VASETPTTISLSEAAAILGVGYCRARQLLAAGDLTGHPTQTGRLAIELASVLQLKRQRESGERQAWRNR